MLYRTSEGTIIEINILNFKSDQKYYESIMKLYKK